MTLDQVIYGFHLVIALLEVMLQINIILQLALLHPYQVKEMRLFTDLDQLKESSSMTQLQQLVQELAQP